MQVGLVLSAERQVPPALSLAGNPLPGRLALSSPSRSSSQLLTPTIAPNSVRRVSTPMSSPPRGFSSARRVENLPVQVSVAPKAKTGGPQELLSEISAMLAQQERRIVAHLEQHGQALGMIQKRLDEQQEQQSTALPPVGAKQKNFAYQLQQLSSTEGSDKALTPDALEQAVATGLPEQSTISGEGSAESAAAVEGKNNNALPDLEAPLLPINPELLHSRKSKVIKDCRHIPEKLQPFGKETASSRMATLFPGSDDLRMCLLGDDGSDYNVEDEYKKTGIFQAIAKHEIFKDIMLIATLTNVVWIGVEQDYDKSDLICKAPLIFQVVDNVYCCFFVFEMIVRFCAFQKKFDALRDTWFLLDTFLVGFMVFEVWIITFLYKMWDVSGRGEIDVAKHIQIFRITRLLRLSRAARSAKAIHSIEAFALLTRGMLRAVHSLLAVLSIMLLIIYSYSVVFAMFLSGTALGHGLFDTVPQSMNSLLLYVLCGPDAEFMHALLAYDWSMYVVFLSFVLVAVLILLNMLTAMLCDVVSQDSVSEKEDNVVKRMSEHLREIASHCDNDGDGLIDRQEFELIMKNPLIIASLVEMGVDVIALAHFAIFVYEQHGAISHENFTGLACSFREGKSATGADIMKLRTYLTLEVLELTSRVAKIEGASTEE